MLKSSHFILSYFFLSISLVLFVLKDFTNPLFSYFLLNLSLVFYVMLILLSIWKKVKHRLIFNPLAISLILNFLFFSGGLTYFFLYENYIPLASVTSNIYLNPIYYAKAGFLINLSSIFMVLGYNTKIALKLNKFTFRITKNFGYKEIRPKTFAIIILILTTYVIKLLLLRNGLLGRIGNVDSSIVESGSNLSSQLSILSKFGLLPLLITSFTFFKYGSNRLLFYLCIILETLFSFLEAARAPILSMFLLLILVHVYVKDRVVFKNVGYGILIFILTFTVVTDFKVHVKTNGISSTSPLEIISDYSKSARSYESFNLQDFYDSAFGRLNYVSEMASAIQYKDEVGLRKRDPPFLNETLFIPLKVFIPNSILGIQNVSYGDWFRLSVLNRGLNTQLYNIAFSPLAFLYFTGGLFFIVMGFLFFGILLKSIEDLHKLGFYGFIFFILLGSNIFQLKTNVPGMLVSFLRVLILIPFVFILSRSLKNIK